MNENIKVGFGILIPVVAIIAFFISLLSEQFLVGILIAVSGVFVWFLYSAVVGAGMPNFTGNIIIVFGVLLSVATFLNYGVEQTMFGGFSLNLEGLSGSAVLLFFVVLLGILFRNKTLAPVAESANSQTIPPPADGERHDGIDGDSPNDYEYEYPDYKDYEDYYADYFDDESPFEYSEEK